MSYGALDQWPAIHAVLTVALLSFGFAAPPCSSEPSHNNDQLRTPPADASQSSRTEIHKDSDSPVTSIYSPDNVFAWCVVPFDSKQRKPEERAQMLKALGFKHFAYDWRDDDITSFDTEIEALKRNGIDLLAWWFPLDADDPKAKAILETFKRHNVHTRLWVALRPASFPKTADEWVKLLPPGMAMPEKPKGIGESARRQEGKNTE